MLVKIKRIDKTLPLPKYETQGSVGFDFVVRQDTLISKKSYGRVPANVIVEVPKGYMLWITDRSSTLKKKGLLISEGVVDQDYCGESDEILIQFYNPSESDVLVEQGERVAQGVFLQIGAPEFEEVDKMQNPSRGGFGSTDSNTTQEKNQDNWQPISFEKDITKPRNSQKGKLIVIDGIDGSGKGTQTKLLIQKLQQEKQSVEKIDFPQYGTKSAGLVENYLNGQYGQLGDVDPYVASFFYALDRYDASFKMRQWLDDGKIIVSDRYVSSSMGHQGSKFYSVEKRQQYIKWLDNYEFDIFGIPRPDFTIILHMPAEIAQKLVDQKAKRDYISGQSRDIHEADLDHLKKSEQVYLEMSQTLPNYVLIECVENGRLLGIEEISHKIWQTTQSILQSN